MSQGLSGVPIMEVLKSSGQGAKQEMVFPGPFQTKPNYNKCFTKLCVLKSDATGKQVSVFMAPIF